MNDNNIVKLTPQIALCYEDKTQGIYLGVDDSHHKKDVLQNLNGDKFISIIAGSIDIKNNETDKISSLNTGKSYFISHDANYQMQKKTNLKQFYFIHQPIIKYTPTKLSTKKVVCIDENNTIHWQETADGFRKKIVYKSQNEKLTVGVWQGANFKTDKIRFPYNEFMLLKSGCLICTDAQSVVHKINSGEALFVPKDSCCSWQSQGVVSLHFVQLKA
jgi:uncharacterized cupin superfamily protein